MDRNRSRSDAPSRYCMLWEGIELKYRDQKEDTSIQNPWMFCCSWGTLSKGCFYCLYEDVYIEIGFWNKIDRLTRLWRLISLTVECCGGRMFHGVWNCFKKLVQLPLWLLLLPTLPLWVVFVYAAPSWEVSIKSNSTGVSTNHPEPACFFRKFVPSLIHALRNMMSHCRTMSNYTEQLGQIHESLQLTV